MYSRPEYFLAESLDGNRESAEALLGDKMRPLKILLLFGMASTSMALLPALRAPPTTLVVRAAGPADVRAKREVGSFRKECSPLLDALGHLCATCLFEPKTQEEQLHLAREMSRNILSRYTPLNSRPNSLLIAEAYVLDSTPRLIGSCGIEAAPMTPEGRSTPKLRTDEERMVVRPLLSNLVVDEQFRRRGIARKLMHEAELRALSWGFSELLIKVEVDNLPARLLYEQLGYVATGVDTLAEKPQYTKGTFCVRWVRTSNIVLRKELTPDENQTSQRTETAVSRALQGMLRGAVAPMRKVATLF